MPPTDLFTATQVVQGGILTCSSTTSDATFATCDGPLLNGVAVQAADAASQLICSGVTGNTGFLRVPGASVTGLFTVSNGAWVFNPAAATSTTQLSCQK